MRRARTVALLGALLVPAIGSCSSDDTPKTDLGPSEWKASVYETVLRDVALPPARVAMPETEKPVVFLVTSDGSGISIDVQVLVAKSVKDEADLRFEDDISDIVHDDEPGQPVKEDGLLLTVSPLPEQSNVVELTVDLYFSENDDREIDVTLTRASTDWTVSTSIPAG